MPKPSKAAVLAWARLIHAHNVALATVERSLKAAGHPPLEWYDVLLELERVGPLRPRDLQARLLLAQSNVSRLLDRMAAAGAIERHPCDDDARGHLVATSEAGRALRQRMWPAYADAIETAVGAKLSDDEHGMLADLLGQLIGPAGAGLPSSSSAPRQTRLGGR
jgi:DNA-binding MarR family transcriptional regulator